MTGQTGRAATTQIEATKFTASIGQQLSLLWRRDPISEPGNHQAVMNLVDDVCSMIERVFLDD